MERENTHDLDWRRAFNAVADAETRLEKVNEAIVRERKRRVALMSPADQAEYKHLVDEVLRCRTTLWASDNALRGVQPRRRLSKGEKRRQSEIYDSNDKSLSETYRRLKEWLAAHSMP